VPSGVVLMRNSDREALRITNNYTGAADSTISGSRSGHAPLFLWYAIQRWGHAGFRQRALKSLDDAAYTVTRLRQLGWPAWRHQGALTVVLAAPPEKLIRKWQLATAAGWSHVICMPGIPRTRIDAFLADLESMTPGVGQPRRAKALPR
jgi:histidine decarboxylase